MTVSSGIGSFSIFANRSDIKHGVSTRLFGSCSLNTTQGRINARRFLETLGLIKTHCVFMKQVHGSRITKVKKNSESVIANVDGMITNNLRVSLVVLSADCVPLIFYDPTQRVVGVAHAGYKGILFGIDTKIVRMVMDEYKSSPRDLLIGIGPGIGACCYTVSQERAEKFLDTFPSFDNFMFRKEKNTIYLDMRAIIQHNLVSLGIPKNNIERDTVCTSCCNDLFFSYRKEGESGVFGSVISMV